MNNRFRTIYLHHKKQIMNNRFRTILFDVAAVLVLLGAILYASDNRIAPYLFAAGAAGVSVCYLTLPVKDLNFRQKRLHRFNVIAGLLMICASGLMFDGRKEWVICLCVAAILQVYTAFVSGGKRKDQNESKQ